MRSQSFQPLGGAYTLAGAADAETRAQFIMRTYNHVFGAILAFVGLQFLFFQTGAAPRIAEVMLSVNWLWILGAFMLVGWLATHVATIAGSQPAQYAALALFVTAQAVIFVPMLFIANHYAPGAISATHDDRPQNGIALCKNHHWLMDHDILVPGPSRGQNYQRPIWHVQKGLDDRFEEHKPVLELRGRSVILPNENRYAPSKEGLDWRMERLNSDQLEKAS